MMQIFKRDKTETQKREMSAALHAIGGKAHPAPPVCSLKCHHHKTQKCEPLCANISTTLTSDPDYPIDHKIAPLAFTLKSLGVFDPCWSCEGHHAPFKLTGISPEIWRKPSVWFYADSVVHVRVLNEAVQKLYCDRLLNTRWHIVVVHSSPDNADTTFSLQPHPVSDAGSTTLDELQEDVLALALCLRNTVMQCASDLLS